MGAGPGDPGLPTLRGGELLVTCDAIVYDALANPALLRSHRPWSATNPVALHDVGKRGGAPTPAGKTKSTSFSCDSREGSASYG